LGYENSGVRVIYNFGEAPIDLSGSEVLIASEPIVGGELKMNQCVWFKIL
jgi:hypothetical protein